MTEIQTITMAVLTQVLSIPGIIALEVLQLVNQFVAMGYSILLKNNAMTGILSHSTAVQIVLKILATPAHERPPIPLTIALQPVGTALKQLMKSVMMGIQTIPMAVLLIVLLSFIQVALLIVLVRVFVTFVGITRRNILLSYVMTALQTKKGVNQIVKELLLDGIAQEMQRN